MVGCENTLIPNSILEIGDCAFQECPGLSRFSIPASVVKIGYNAFKSCPNLYSVFIPNKVASIASGCFSSCERLAEIKVSPRNAHYDSRERCNAIIETSTNTLVQGCSFSVIPQTVTKIGDSAFEGCGCLTSIMLPDSVVEVGKKAFFGCVNLEELVLPNTIEAIGDYAFSDTCLNSLLLPGSLVKLGKNPFPLNQLKSINVDPLNPVFDSRDHCNAIIETQTDTLLYGCENVTIPDTVKEIGTFAFSSAKIEEIKIPNTVKTIQKGAFASCLGLRKVIIKDRSLLNKVMLPMMVQICDDPSLAKSIPNNQDNNLKELESVLKDVLIEAKIAKMDDLFSLILQFRHGFLKQEGVWRRDALLFALKYYIKEFYDLKFIKYIYIYNNVEDDKFGTIACYVDLMHSYCGAKRIRRGKRLFTDTKTRVDLCNNMLNEMENTIKRIHDQGGYCKLFEYSPEKDFLLLNSGYSISRNHAAKSDSSAYVYGVELSQYADKSFDRLLSKIETSYGDESASVTNFIYLTGSPWIHPNTLMPVAKAPFIQEEELWQYTLCAAIGIDNRREDSEVIKVFLHKFQDFIEQLSFILFVEVQNYQHVQSCHECKKRTPNSQSKR